MLPGLLYLWALLPVSFRPQYTGSPLRKPDAIVSVDVTAARAFGATGHLAVTAASAAGVQNLSNSRLKQACEPPGLLKPIVRPAQHVVVRYLDNGKVLAEKHYDCSKYL